MADLDVFLLQEIFVRLPVKSLHRFKCVSKHWLSLISDTCFVHEYVQFQSRRANDDHDDAGYKNLCRMTFIYTAMQSRTPRRLEYPHFPSYAFDQYEGFSFKFIPRQFLQNITLIAASHGWILCSSESSYSSYFRIYDYHLCSPLFKQWIDIPRPPKPKDRSYRLPKSCSVGFMCEEDIITRCSSNSNTRVAVRPPQFKVVKTFNYVDLRFHGVDLFIVLVFSSESWKWRKSKIICKSSRHLWSNNPWIFLNPCIVSCDGTLYWNERGMSCLFALDLDGDGNPLHWSYIPLPTTSVSDPIDDAHLGLCLGQIHLSWWGEDCGGTNIKTHISIWKLIKEVHIDDHQNHYQWSFKHRITIDCYSVLKDPFGFVEMVYCAPLNEDILYIRFEPNHIVLFNLKNNTMTETEKTELVYHDWNIVPFLLPYWPLPLKTPKIPALEEKKRKHGNLNS